MMKAKIEFEEGDIFEMKDAVRKRLDEISNTELSKLVLKRIFKNTYCDKWEGNWNYVEDEINNHFSLMFEESVSKALKSDFYHSYLKEIVKDEVGGIINKEVDSMRGEIRKIIKKELTLFFKESEIDDLIVRSFSQEEIAQMLIKKDKSERGR